MHRPGECKNMGYRGAFIESFRGLSTGSGKIEAFTARRRVGSKHSCIESYSRPMTGAASTLRLILSRATGIGKTLARITGECSLRGLGKIGRKSISLLNMMAYHITQSQTDITSREKKAADSCCTEQL